MTEIFLVVTAINVAVLHEHFSLALFLAILKRTLVKLTSAKSIHTFPIEIISFPVPKVFVPILTIEHSLARFLAFVIKLPNILPPIPHLLPPNARSQLPMLIHHILLPENLIQLFPFLHQLRFLFLRGYSFMAL